MLQNNVEYKKYREVLERKEIAENRRSINLGTVNSGRRGHADGIEGVDRRR